MNLTTLRDSLISQREYFIEYTEVFLVTAEVFPLPLGNYIISLRRKKKTVKKLLIDKEIVKSTLVKYILEIIFQTSQYSKYKKYFYTLVVY